MSQPIKSFNEARAARATSERRFELGPYVFTRRVSVAPEVVMAFQAGVGAGDDDIVALHALENTIREICEPTATDAHGNEVAFDVAWQAMREQGDEYGPVSIQDLGDIVQWLIAGVIERPTGQPSDSSDGSETPAPGTPSMAFSPSEASTSPPLTLAEQPMPSTPSL